MALEGWPQSGVRFVGLVFFPPSPRHLDTKPGRLLADRARRSVKVVALAVDPDDRLVDTICADVAPDFLQLHGKETPERVRDIRRRTRRPIIKAISVETKADVARAEAYFEPGHGADLILFDAKPPKGAILPGGNGVPFDWRLLDGVNQSMPFMLSGGLTPGNVAEAIRLSGAASVDVSSGVERAPGVKDPDLIRRFIRAVNNGRERQP